MKTKIEYVLKFSQILMKKFKFLKKWHFDVIMMQFEFLKTIEITNKKLNNFMKKYTYYYTNPAELPEIACQNFEQSNFLMINYFDESEENGYFIICFNFTIIIILRSHLQNLLYLLSKKQNLDIYFLNNAKDKFNLKISYNEKKFPEEFDISDFNQNLCLKKRNHPKIWDKYIVPCISEYLIMSSFEKKSDRFNDFSNTQNQFEKQEKVKEKEYIFIRDISSTDLFSIKLIYHIETQLMFVIKFPIGTEHLELIQRESEYYQNKNLLHPLLPKFFGTTTEGYIIIEYIKGKTLDKIKELGLNEDEKLGIIIKLVLIIIHLHYNNFIYSDLKPNNIIIDHDKNPILIDFDNMIYNDKMNELNSNSRNFNLPYLAPENTFKYESDVYSFGKLLYFIMTEKEPQKKNYIKIEDFGKYPELFEIYLNCINENYRLRPNPAAILFRLFRNYDNLITTYSQLLKISQPLEIDNKEYKSYIINSRFYELDCDNGDDIEKKYSDSDFDSDLSVSYTFFTFGYCIMKKDRKKSIKCLEKAISNNLATGEIYCLLGYIYYFFGDVRNIGKAIENLNKAIKHNYSHALFLLGFIYYENAKVNKAIKYLAEAINYKNKYAYYLLGLIYYNGRFVQQNIPTAISYFEQAIKYNYKSANAMLFLIFSSGIFVKKDFKKAISYCSENDIENDIEKFLGSIHMCKLLQPETIDEIEQNEFEINFFEYIPNILNDYLEPIDEKHFCEKTINYLIQLAMEDSDEVDTIIVIYHFQVLKANNNIPYISDDLNFLVSILPCSVYNFVNKLVEYSIESNISSTIENFVISIAEKSPFAQSVLWYTYLYIPKYFDLHKALKYLVLAAKNNDAQASLIIGFIYFLKHFYPTFNIDLLKVYVNNYSPNQIATQKLIQMVTNILKSIKTINPNKDLMISSFECAQRNGLKSASFALSFIFSLDRKYDYAKINAELLSDHPNSPTDFLMGLASISCLKMTIKNMKRLLNISQKLQVKMNYFLNIFLA